MTFDELLELQREVRAHIEQRLAEKRGVVGLIRLIYWPSVLRTDAHTNLISNLVDKTAQETLRETLLTPF